MTTPPVGPPCDVCGAEPAFASVMQMSNYETMKLGLNCLPQWMLELATTMITSPETARHASVPGDCEACWAIHALMKKPVPRPGEPAPADAAAAAPLEAAAAADPDSVPAGPPVAAAAVPAPATTVSPDRERQLAATAAQKSLLATFGIPSPDMAQCPVDGTPAFTVPGFSTFVCPYCGGTFTPDTAPSPAPVPEGDGGEELGYDDDELAGLNPPAMPAAGLPADTAAAVPPGMPF